MQYFITRLFVYERKQIALMAEEKSPSRISLRLFAINRSEMENIMIKRKDLEDLFYEEDGIGVVEIILILVVLIMLVVIFRKQITSIVSNAFSNINEDSDTINEDIELEDE